MPLSKKSLWLFSASLCAFIAILASVITWTVHWHWLNTLWFHYGWPSDLGNGPEAIQQTIFYFIIAAIFVPVVRQFFKREVAALHEKLDHAHAKIDHMIYHSNIPPMGSVILPTESPETRSDSEE